MIKAMLIITALGGADHRVEMPTMESCLDARISILKQDDTVDTLCVPRENEAEKVGKIFDMFTSMIERMRKIDEDDRYRSWFDEPQNFTGDERTEKCN
tara:strand:+ start:281 stop:574 length:294 start_codon:yes stop_codon:yes gene_type:complete